ncbi:hypothetical protein IWW48_003479 [Coemansia sp. RSA 1200]|nr:hypothetical protein IWW48_003479 [Coemansia sp. RSA 1200]
MFDQPAKESDLAASFIQVVKRGVNRRGDPRPKETRPPKAKLAPAFFSVIHMLKAEATAEDEMLRLPPRELVNGATEDAIIIDTSVFPTEDAALIAVKAICVPMMADYRPKRNKLLLAFDHEHEADLVLCNPPVYNGTTVKVIRPIPREENMVSINITVSGAKRRLRPMVNLLREILSPLGKICDLCVNIREDVVHCNATAILDRQERKGSLPSRIQRGKITILLYGKEVAPYCYYCRREGHTPKKCAKQALKKTAPTVFGGLYFNNLTVNAVEEEETSALTVSRSVKSSSTKRSRVVAEDKPVQPTARQAEKKAQKPQIKKSLAEPKKKVVDNMPIIASGIPII